MSKGADLLYSLLEEIFPGYQIQSEVTLHISPRQVVYVDFLVPSLKLAFEVDGRQHDEFVPFFHKNKRKFKAAQVSDKEKEKALEKLGYTLVRFKATERIASGTVQSKINRALGK